LVEQGTFNPWVQGSSPWRPTTVMPLTCEDGGSDDLSAGSVGPACSRCASEIVRHAWLPPCRARPANARRRCSSPAEVSSFVATTGKRRSDRARGSRADGLFRMDMLWCDVSPALASTQVPVEQDVSNGAQSEICAGHSAWVSAPARANPRIRRPRAQFFEPAAGPCGHRAARPATRRQRSGIRDRWTRPDRSPNRGVPILSAASRRALGLSET
jgi:hypothetical protein